MNSLDDLLNTHADSILFECIAGSRAYGTHTAQSDKDIRGIFALPVAAYLSLMAPPNQIGDERSNIVYFSLRRTIELCAQANPNMLELLFMPQDCVRRTSLEAELLFAQRQLFISKQCADTHAGYAMAQIKKARGQNKWINNPKPVQPPRKEDFCYVIPRERLLEAKGIPARPIKLQTLGWNLDHFHAARLEHAQDTYRLYRYGSDARGVFRGDALACEPIPEDDEATHFAGLLLYNEAAWQQSLNDHRNYWQWRNERNEARWQQQERGELDFDAKNMMHTMRLLLSARALLSTGLPMVRFAGDSLTLLMDIRGGRYSFERILAMANDLLADCERLKAASKLPDVCDAAQASELLLEISRSWERRIHAR